MSEWAGRAWPDNINRVMYQTIKTDPSNQIRKLRTQNIKYHKQHLLNVYLRPKYRYSIITSWKNQKRSKYHIKHIHWNAGIAVHFFCIWYPKNSSFFSLSVSWNRNRRDYRYQTIIVHCYCLWPIFFLAP